MRLRRRRRFRLSSTDLRWVQEVDDALESIREPLDGLLGLMHKLRQLEREMDMREFYLPDPEALLNATKGCLERLKDLEQRVAVLEVADD